VINSNTSFGKLKEVIVGRELEIPKRIADFSFQHFYQENLNEPVYERLYSDGEEYYVNHEILVKRNKQLDRLEQLLEEFGIKVHRPDKLKKIIPFKTPHFKSELSSASNVRDLSLIYNICIIETPTFCQNRYFENVSLYRIYNNGFNGGKGGLWIRPPHTKLTKETMDLQHWNSKRDYKNFDREKYTMAIDGAQYLRIGVDVIVNINSYNHYLGHEWIKSFFPKTKFHIVHLTDNHIDGVITCLCPGVFLVNPLFPNIKESMPGKFKNWKYLIPEEDTKPFKLEKGMTSLDIQLASARGMDMNVLSLNEKTVMVNNRAKNVIKLLEDNNFEVIKVELDNCEIFGGGIGCSTLDLVRDDKLMDYTK
jgi:glycine amidinotransferase|tara:strand:- start:552 stop:1646 length:1095 start_codon:yes stop_codon:yes gene_type:complete